MEFKVGDRVQARVGRIAGRVGEIKMLDLTRRGNLIIWVKYDGDPTGYVYPHPAQDNDLEPLAPAPGGSDEA